MRAQFFFGVRTGVDQPASAAYNVLWSKPKLALYMAAGRQARGREERVEG